MKEFGRISKETLGKMKDFWGGRFNGTDKERYASVLNRIEFPDIEEKTDKMVALLCDQAEKELALPFPTDNGGRICKGITIKKLGIPFLRQWDEQKRTMEQMSQQMGYILAGYEEVLELSVAQDPSDMEETEVSLRLATEDRMEERLISLVRSTYGRVKTGFFSDDDVRYPHTLYALLSVSDRKSEKKKELTPEKINSNWVDRVVSSLPGDRHYRVTVRIVPLGFDDPIIADSREKMQRLYDQLYLYGETDWNQASNIGASYNRGFVMPKNVTDSVERIHPSGNYGETFGMTHHQKNKRAELMLKQLDQRICRFGTSGQKKLWQVVLSVEAEDEDILQVVCAAINGSLKKDWYETGWCEDRCTAAIMTAEELLPLLRFPTREFAGFEFVRNEDFSLVSPADHKEGVCMGDILLNGKKIKRFFLPEQALNRHAFICGMTGSGKTNTLFKILEEIKLPFLVIEPVKGEYRSLCSRFEDLHIYTMNAEVQSRPDIGILRINPFWFPKNTNIAFHVDSIKSVIASAFEMSNAMPNILEQCMYNIYIKAGWNIITNKNRYEGTIPDEFLYPTFLDLLEEVEDYLDHSKFVGETLGDYHGAMTTRLKSFVGSYKGLLLNTELYPDYAGMMNGRTIIELEGLAEDADKCLVMGTVLVQYFEYLKLHFDDSGQKLKHLFVIEEAHRLFKNVGNGSKNRDGGADPTGQLVESLSNIMAEIRAFGEGMVIVDQSPSKIAEDVIKNSSTKIIHRIDNEKDIKLLQAALLMRDDKNGISALAQGETLIRSEGMCRPCKVLVHRSDIKEKYLLSGSFQSREISDMSLENAFAAMAVLSDETVVAGIHSALWCLLMGFEKDGFYHWKEKLDEFFCNIVKILMERRRYDLVDGKMDVVRQIVAQSVRQLRSSTSVSIGINELGYLHLFLQRFFDFYGEACNGIVVKQGNIHLFEKFFINKIAAFVYEHARNLCASASIGGIGNISSS